MRHAIAGTASALPLADLAMAQYTNEQFVLLVINTVMPGLSCIGAFVVIYYYFKHRTEQTASYWHLMLWMSVSDIGMSVADFLSWSAAHEQGPCLAQSLLMSFFDWASVAWVGCVAHYMHRCICVPKDVTPAVRLRLLVGYHTFSWSTSLLLTLLPFADGFDADGYPSSYGFDGDWCWIKSGAPYHWYLNIFYIPLWIVELYVVYVVVRCRAALRGSIQTRRPGTGSSAAKQRLYKTLVGYPVVLFLTWLVGTVRRGWQTVDYFSGGASLKETLGSGTKHLTQVHLAMASLGGLFNAIFFLATFPRASGRTSRASSAQMGSIPYATSGEPAAMHRGASDLPSGALQRLKSMASMKSVRSNNSSHSSFGKGGGDAEEKV